MWDFDKKYQPMIEINRFYSLSLSKRETILEQATITKCNFFAIPYVIFTKPRKSTL